MESAFGSGGYYLLSFLQFLYPFLGEGSFNRFINFKTLINNSTETSYLQQRWSRIMSSLAIRFRKFSCASSPRWVLPWAPCASLSFFSLLWYVLARIFYEVRRNKFSIKHSHLQFVTTPLCLYKNVSRLAKISFIRSASTSSSLRFKLTFFLSKVWSPFCWSCWPSFTNYLTVIMRMCKWKFFQASTCVVRQWKAWFYATLMKCLQQKLFIMCEERKLFNLAQRIDHK